jgi:hypothetical protein
MDKETEGIMSQSKEPNVFVRDVWAGVFTGHVSFSSNWTIIFGICTANQE